jgi:hypothetical protein
MAPNQFGHRTARSENHQNGLRARGCTQIRRRTNHRGRARELSSTNGFSTTQARTLSARMQHGRRRRAEPPEVRRSSPRVDERRPPSSTRHRTGRCRPHPLANRSVLVSDSTPHMAFRVTSRGSMAAFRSDTQAALQSCLVAQSIGQQYQPTKFLCLPRSSPARSSCAGNSPHRLRKSGLRRAPGHR